MEDSFAEIGRALSLAEQENLDVVVPREIWGRETDYSLSLVGRVVMRRAYNFDALKEVLLRVINPRKGMQFRKIGADRLIITFNHPSIFIILPQEHGKEIWAEFIGNKLGKYRAMDWYKDDPSSLTEFKLRVGLNIQNPLRRIMKIRSPDGEDYVIQFTYERLPNFCFLCGLIGHISKDCEMHYTDGFVDPGSNTPFGPWLRQTGTTKES
ncbi:hypothetical protein Salat_2046800 [Sesamum alatum]|uniref:CCHC-type domain-containing protein n=1 Tax=Sesamum alatum TaxID=300844 RepID=A0AAE2CG71_9LAMI|nr:hypothetical protein Salat_2046800 [Sesamum alatum]